MWSIYMVVSDTSDMMDELVITLGRILGKSGQGTTLATCCTKSDPTLGNTLHKISCNFGQHIAQNLKDFGQDLTRLWLPEICWDFGTKSHKQDWVRSDPTLG